MTEEQESTRLIWGTLLVIAAIVMVLGWQAMKSGILDDFDDSTRHPSPDGTLEAVVQLMSTGGTSGDIHSVVIVPVEEGGGADPEEHPLVLRLTRAKGLQLFWSDADTLTVTVDRANLHHITPNWRQEMGWFSRLWSDETPRQVTVQLLARTPDGIDNQDPSNQDLQL
ncbi:MAG: hypothetical protein HQL50_14550 [Magnetococcales bacterium]|nr:hypothetical protein [Magnetococcales bacterium]